MMTDWYQRCINALQLNGKGESTQEAYTRAVRMLSTFSSKPPAAPVACAVASAGAVSRPGSGGVR